MARQEAGRNLLNVPEENATRKDIAGIGTLIVWPTLFKKMALLTEAAGIDLSISGERAGMQMMQWCMLCVCVASSSYWF